METLKETNILHVEEYGIDPKQWVDKYADFMFTYAFIRVNDKEQAQDLVQETFLAALEKISSFEGRSSEKTWLVSILKNKIFDVYRKRSSGLAVRIDQINTEDEREDFFDPERGEWNKVQVPALMGIEDNEPFNQKEFNVVLEGCMLKLPALWLSVFKMKHMDDQSSQTICSELNVTPSNFWVIIHRAKLNLRACLQKNWI